MSKDVKESDTNGGKQLQQVAYTCVQIFTCACIHIKAIVREEVVSREVSTAEAGGKKGESGGTVQRSCTEFLKNETMK